MGRRGVIGIFLKEGTLARATVFPTPDDDRDRPLSCVHYYIVIVQEGDTINKKG